MTLDDMKKYTDVVGPILALIAFGVALWQYAKAQSWKRSEFVERAIGEFRNDPLVRDALSMLEYQQRHIAIPEAEDGKGRVIPATIALATMALRDEPDEHEVDCDAIRDRFDRLFDRLERLQIFIARNLVKVEEVRPHVEYWFQKMGGDSKDDPERQAFTKALNSYVAKFYFEEVEQLAKVFKVNLGRFWCEGSPQSADLPREPTGTTQTA